MSLESSERMEFRFGDEYDTNKLWLVYHVNSMELEIITYDSHHADQSRKVNSGHFSQLLDWMQRVDGCMHGEDTPRDDERGS